MGKGAGRPRVGHPRSCAPVVGDAHPPGLAGVRVHHRLLSAGLRLGALRGARGSPREGRPRRRAAALP